MATVALPDPKKRALDALDRRYAAAKAHNDPSTPPQPPSSSAHKGKSTPSSSSSSASASQSHNSFDGENAIYSDISESLHPNLLQGLPITMDTTRREREREREKDVVVENILIDIMRKGDETASAVSGAKKLKRETWVLLDPFLPKDDNSLANARAKSLKTHSKRSKTHMSLKHHRHCGSFHFPNDFHNFELFKPMHAMWKEYISEPVKDTGKKLLADRLLTADLHGAFLTVVESKVVSYVGSSGIMVRETTETFGIVSENNKFRVVPKAGSVFMLQAHSWTVTLCGDMLSAKKRFKESVAQKRLQSLLR